MNNSKDRAVILLGNDTGFAEYGWCTVRLLPDAEQVLAMGVIRTECCDAKREILTAGDNFRRTRLLARGLRMVASASTIRAATYEAISPVQNSAVNVKVGLAFGVLAAFAEERELPVVEVSPKDLKRKITGDGSASKVQVALKLAARYGLRLVVPAQKRGTLEVLHDGRDLLAHVPAGLHNHAWDALATVVAGLDSDIIRALRPR